MIVALSGSRSGEGQTASAVDAFLAGVQDTGAAAEHVFLPRLRLERCRQCDDDGWGECIRAGSCAIDDDFHALVGRIKRADAVVFATPVYFSDLSESLKSFLDRLRRTCMHENGASGIRDKKAAGICVAGGGGGGAPQCCLALEQTLQRCGFEVVDVIPARRQNLHVKLHVLRETGRWLASSGGSARV